MSQPWHNLLRLALKILATLPPGVTDRPRWAWGGGSVLAARDLFDVALVMEEYPDLLLQQQALLTHNSDAIINRINTAEAALSKAFASIKALDFTPSFEQCKQCLLQLVVG